jgi:TRAP transporter TAXI family solute receptor
MPSLRLAWGGYFNYHTFIAAVQSVFRTWEDLRGKRVGICPQATTCTQIAEATLKATGLSLDDIDEQYLSFNEQADALADRKLDAAAIFGGVPGAAVLAATSRGDMTFLSVSEDMQKAINAEDPGFVPVTLPANSYPGQTEPVPVMGTAVLFVASEDMPAEAIAEITDILYANVDELANILPLMQFFTPDNELTKAEPIIPRHEGLEAHLLAIGALN